MLLLGATAVSAQSEAEMKVLEQYVQMVKGDLTAKRDSAMRTLVQVEGAQAEKLWALVKEYDHDGQAVRDKRRALIVDFLAAHDELADEASREIADRSFALQEERTALPLAVK